MNKDNKNNRCQTIRRVILVVMLFTFGMQLAAQDKIVNFLVNRYWGGVSEQNSKSNFLHPNLNLFSDYSAYGVQLNGTATNFGGGYLSITQTNWTAPDGRVIPTAVITPTNSYLPNGNVVSTLESYVRYNNPVYTVETNDMGPVITDIGTVDPAKCIGTSDQSVHVINEYANGVQVERKILGWSQQFNDNYVIVDLTFTNKSNQPISGMYVSIIEEQSTRISADGTNPEIAAVDAKNNSRLWHYIGSKTSDDIRVIYGYDADDPDKSGDQMGQPLTQQHGRLLKKDMSFCATLWASKQAYIPSGNTIENHDQNDVDDMSQPSVATVGNLFGTLGLPLYPLDDPGSPAAEKMYDFVSGNMLSSLDQTGSDIRPGHFRQNLDDMGITNAGGQPGISAKAAASEAKCLSYGPYNLQPGQQVRVVLASGFAGLSREKAMEIGQQWLEGTLTDPMPDKPKGNFPDNFAFPNDATDQDIYKDKWLSTGIDSVILTVNRAIHNFKSGYQTPVTPPPPSSFEVLGTGDGIELIWSNPEAEAMSGFQGYRIMRKVSMLDTAFYQQIATIPASDKAATHSYTDTTDILFGAQYFYYVQAGVQINENDQNAYPDDRGKTIWSGRTWFLQNTAVSPKRIYQDDLSKIVIAPNPYNFNDPNLKGYGFTDDRGILFFNLPYQVTIKIFTESGNLVKTIEHNEPTIKTGSVVWNMTNENRQPIASGVYVVLFQKPDGSLSYQKLAVAR